MLDAYENTIRQVQYAQDTFRVQLLRQHFEIRTFPTIFN